MIIIIRNLALFIVLSIAMLFCLLPTAIAQAKQNITVEVQALFPKQAMLKINGQQKLLKAGQDFAGVTLVSASAKRAVVEINGKRTELGLTKRITSNYQQVAKREVVIPRNAAYAYETSAEINGYKLLVMVDTGANIIALNENHAIAMGLRDYQEGAPMQAETASGVTSGWRVILRSVDVGGIRVENVEAAVLSGSFPVRPLLGMTYLKHVKIQEHEGILTLTKAY